MSGVKKKKRQTIDFFSRGVYNGRMGKFIYDLKLKTRYIEYDFRDELKLSSVFAWMQEAAGIGADRMGVGSDFLWPKGWGFIVTEYALELYRPVPIGSLLTVHTWPLLPKHVVMERCFDFLDEKGEKCGAALSKWCLLDLKGQKMLPVSALGLSDPDRFLTKKDVEMAGKLPNVSVDGLQPAYRTIVSSSDYDHYRHVNNTRYVDFCMNCFSVEEWEKRKVAKFRIAYVEQCFYGEELLFYRVPLSDKEYLLIGQHGDQKTFVKAKITFA